MVPSSPAPRIVLEKADNITFLINPTQSQKKKISKHIACNCEFLHHNKKSTKARIGNTPRGALE
jgi:hypothetical protein